MRYWVKDVFEQFDLVCRSIFKAAEAEASSSPLPDRAASYQEFEPAPGEGTEENSYADHVARGMAKVRARR
jgi:hypothetical protein